MRYVCSLTAILMVFLASGQAPTGLSITNQQVVSETRISRTVSDFEYRADLVNPGAARPLVVATLTSKVPAIAEVRQGNVRFVNVPATGRVTSANTFILRVDRSQPFSWNDIEWAFAAPTAPVAHAGPNQTVALRTNVRLDGSGSTNPPGSGTLSYAWEFVSKPEGSTAALTGANTMNPTFPADLLGNYVVRLTVGNLASTSSSTVTISTVNSAPVANAGPNQTAATGATVQLTGAASSDVDGDAITYKWTLTTRPQGSTAALSSTTIVNPTLRIDKPGSYAAQLIVNDGKVDSNIATVTISTVNSAPVANAGSAQTVGVNSVVQLDGAGSTDVDGDTLTYVWSLNSKPDGSTAALSSTTIVNPTFRIDKPGNYVAQLIVSDGNAASAAATVTISTNAVQAPTANPGTAQTARQGATVTLTGGGTDPQGLPLTFQWSLTTKPEGSTAALSSLTAQSPTFRVDKTGNYVAQLIVNNGFVGSAPATVTVTTTGSAPVANAGAAQTVFMRSAVNLDGTASADADGDPITYAWTFSSRPSGSTAALSGANSSRPSFTPDLAGPYVVQLIVNDGFQNSAPVTVTITANRPKPVANAGAAQSANVNANVQLNGSSSTSIDGAPLTYQWSFQSRPDGSTATLTNPTQVNPTFRIDKTGQYVVQLIVNDGTLSSDPATVTISTNTVQPPTANAGTDQTVRQGATVQLTGSGTDPLSLPITYQWTIATAPADSTATLSSAAAQSPTFVADKTGTFVLRLVTNNGFVNSAPATVSIAVNSAPPTANAGSAQTVKQGATVSLTGTSNDPQSFPLTHQWSFSTKPIDSAATLANATTLTPTFVADKTGTYEVRLVASNQYSSSTPSTVTITVESAPPTANPGTDRTVKPGATVTLNGGGTDPQNFPLTYAWTLTTRPLGSNAALSSTTAQNPTFRADKLGTFTASLVVNNGYSNSVAATVNITVAGNPPTANAGPAQTVFTNSVVTLNGSASSDEDGNPLTYSWILTKPAGSSAALSSATVVSPTFLADKPGTYTASLTVDNGFYASTAASVTITVNDRGTVNLPATPVVELGQAAAFPVSLSAPAPAGGVTVQLVSADTSKVTIAPASVTIAEGATAPASQPTITGVRPGTAVITGSAIAFTTGTTTARTNATISLTPSSITIEGTATKNLTLTLSAPAPAGGFAVNLTSSNPSAATVPAGVTIAAGATTAAVPVTGVGLSAANATSTIRATATDVTDATATVTVNRLDIIVPAVVIAALNEVTPYPVQLARPPLDTVFVQLVSSDTNKVTTNITNVLFNPGQTTPVSQPTIRAIGSGAVTITASAVGLNTALTQVQVGLGLSFAQPSYDLGMAGAGGSQTQNLILQLSGPAPSGGLEVALNSSNPAAATVPAVAIIPAAATSTSVPVTMVAPGITVITATSPIAGSATANITVNPPAAIVLPPTQAISFGQTTQLPVTLNTPAPAGGLTVSVASTNPTLATVSPASVTFAAGATQPQTTPTVTGLDFGNATIQAQANGYAGATSTVQVGAALGFLQQTMTISAGGSQLAQLTFSVSGPSTGVTVSLSSSNPAVATVPATLTIPQNGMGVQVPVTALAVGTTTITATANAPNIPPATVAVTVQPAGSNGAITLPSTATVAVGQNAGYNITLTSPAGPAGVTVALTTSNASVATISPAQVTITSGNTAPITQPQITGVGVGNVNVNASAAGYVTATAPVQVTTAGALGFASSNVSVTAGATGTLTVTIPAAAPAGGVAINLSSSNTAAATVPATVTVAQGNTSAAVTVTGVATGTAVITASSAAYSSATANITVGAGIGITLPSNFTVAPGETKPFPITLASAATAQTTVSLQSSDTGKFTFSTPNVTIATGATTPAAQPTVTGLTAGSATATASGPGLITTTAPVTVGHSMSLTPSPLSITGTATQNMTVLLNAPAASALTINLASSTPAVATVTPTVNIAAGASSVSFAVTGVTPGTTTITATASGIPNATATVNVLAPSVINVPSTVNVQIDKTSTFAVTLPAPAPAGGVTVTLASANTARAIIEPATVFIAEGATAPASQPRVKGINVGPVAVTASAPGYVTGTGTVQVGLTVHWQDSSISLSPSQNRIVYLVLNASAPWAGVTVNFSSSNSSVASIRDSVDVYPDGSEFTTVAVNISAGATPGTATITASGLNIPAATFTVNVGGSTLAIQTASLPNGTVGTPYSTTLSATGGTAPRTWSITGGTLPGGLTLNGTTGIISGTPTAAVTASPITLMVTDSSTPAQTASVTLPLTIAASGGGGGGGTGTMTLTPSPLAVTTGATGTLTVTLSAAAPAGGTTVNLTSATTSVATVPATVTVGAGATTASVTVTGVAAGSSVITASAANFGSATATANVTNPAGTADFILPQNLTVAPGQSTPFPVTLAAPAAGQTFVTLTVSDTAKATLSTSSFIIQTGNTAPTSTPNITGVAAGTVTVTAAATGLNSASTSVTIGNGMAFSPNTMSLTGSATSNLSLALTSAAQGNLVVSLTSSNPSLATVPTQITISNGGSSTFVPVTGVAPGNVTITASAPGYPNATAQVTVLSPGTLSVAAVNVPLGQTRPLAVSVSTPAPTGGLTVNLVSSDGTKATVPATVTIPAGATAPTTAPMVTGVNTGSATITASAAGYTAGSGTATVDATVTWTSVNPNVTAGASESLNLLLSSVAPAAGLTVQLSSSNPAVATVPATAVFLPTSSDPTSVAVSVTGVSAGTTVITASGVNIPATTITVTVNGPLTITTASLPNGVVATSYSTTLTATGGKSPYTWTLDSGTLPAGITLNSNGSLGGTPTAAVENASLTFRVTDSSSTVQTVTKTLSMTIGAQTPASVTMTSGSPQTAAINTAFANPLAVTVRDAANNPVSGVTVTFSAPASGASAAFAGGVNTATTNAAGLATSPVLTANGTLGSFTVTAAVSGVATPASFNLTNSAGSAASITVSGGNNQTTAVGSAFASNLAVTVRDASNNPVSGVTVTFTAPASGASGNFANGISTGTTNASGVVSLGFMANNVTGAYTVTAAVPGVSTPASFSLTNTAGSAASVAVHAGNNQTAVATGNYQNPLAVIVRDAGGNPVAGVTVTFGLPTTGASATFAAGQTTAVTNTSGIATSAALTANNTLGAFAVTATAAGVSTPATFNLTNTAGGPASITATAGDNQAATVNTAFANPLVVLVKDASNNPVSGVTVTFAAPASGASAAFAGGNVTAITNSSGVATSAALTANATSGSFTVTASVSGVSTPASFTLTNNAGAPASIVATAGQSQTTGIGSAFATPFQVTVKDAGNNPVGGATVTFTAPASGAGGAFAGGVNTATTNASGVATAPVFTANNTTGAYTVQASVPGAATSATFNLTNTAGAAASVAATSGTPQSATINAAFAQALTVTVRDAGNNPVGGVSVTFTAPSTGARATLSSPTATTNASGVATVNATAGSVAGSYNVSASVSGVATAATFALTNNAGPASTVTATSGTPQTASVGAAFSQPLKATVTDLGGNALQGVTVTFTAPGSGASGTFAGGVNTATTDANGVATSPTFTANGTIGSYVVTASVPGVTAASFALSNAGGPPASITLLDGSGQSTLVGAAFPTRLQAVVRDASNNPITGAVVTFALSSGGAGGSFDQGVHSVLTNAAGVATANVLTANAIPGSWVASASVPGVVTPVTFALTNLSAGGGSNAITLGSTTVGQNLQTALAISIPNPAPAGGTQVTLTSGNTSLVRLAGRLADPGSTAPLRVTIGEGQTTVSGVYVHGMAASGSVTITATASGLDPGTATVTLSPSGFVISGPTGLGVQTLSTGTGAASVLTVTSVRLDSSLRFAEVQAVRGATTAVVPLSMSPTSGLGTLSTANLSIAGGASSGNVNFTAGAPGVGTVTAGTPSGYTTPGNGANVLNVTIFAGSLIANQVWVGRDLQTVSRVQLSAPAGPAGVQVTLTSADPAKVRFSSSATTAGLANGTLVFTIPSGRTTGPDFYVQALSETGPVTYQAVASGYSPVTGTVNLSRSAVVLSGPFGLAQDFFTTVGSADVPLTVDSVRIDATGDIMEGQPVRAGYSVSVNITSSNTVAGTAVNVPITLGGNQQTGVAAFHSAGEGETTLTVVQPSGFATPAWGDSLIGSVRVPGIVIADGVALGNKLQSAGTVLLGRVAGAGGVVVTLSAAPGSGLLLAASPTAAGASTITVTVPAGSSSANYYLQGDASSGTATYTASAPGYASKTASVDLYPSGVVIEGPFGRGFPMIISNAAGPQNALVTVGILDPWSMTFAMAQPLAGGQTLTVSLNNSNAGVATIPSSVTIAAGGYDAVVTVTPVATGSTALSVNTPAGFTAPLGATSLSVTVNP